MWSNPSLNCNEKQRSGSRFSSCMFSWDRGPVFVVFFFLWHWASVEQMTIQKLSVLLSKRNRYLLGTFLYTSTGFSGLPAASTTSLENMHGIYHDVIPPVLISPYSCDFSSSESFLHLFYLPCQIFLKYSVWEISKQCPPIFPKVEITS